MTDNHGREILTAARETLHRIRFVKVERRNHRDDGFVSDWARTMPPKPPPVTADDVRKMITDAVAGLPRAVTPQAAAEIIHEVRQQLRKEVAEEVGKLNAEIEKLKRGGTDQSATTTDPPQLPLRSARYG